MSEFEQKVIKLLGDINGKLDSLLKGDSGTATVASYTSPAPSSATTPGQSRPKPSELVERQKEEEKMIEKPPVEGRRVCPKCGGKTFNAIEDKSQVLHQMGGVKIYAKKYICKGCGTEV